MERIREEAERLTRAMARVLAERGMSFPAREAVVARGWLIVSLDPARMPGLAPYRGADLLAHLRAVLGRPVLVLTDPGFHYAIPLLPRPALPERLPFPGLQPGRLRLGMGPRGEVALPAVPLRAMGHGFVAGQSRFGKSNFLRLIAVQALALGMQVHLLDPEGQLLASVRHPGLRRWGLEEFPDLLDLLEAERDARNRLLAEAEAEDLVALNRQRAERGERPLPRWLVLLDELEAVLAPLPGDGPGGVRQRRQRLMRMLWRGLKGGIHIIAAAHEPTREEFGNLMKGFLWRASFRLLTPAVSRAFLGTDLAARLRRPGLCYSPELGLFQTYWLPPDPEQIEGIACSLEGWLSSREQEILTRVVDPEGRIPLPRLMEWMPERKARALQERLRTLGAAYKDPRDHNVHRLVPEVLERLRRASRASKNGNPISAIAEGRLTEIGLSV